MRNVDASEAPDAFWGVPILVHDADRDRIARTSPSIEPWSGDRLDVSLLHLSGHFPGSRALHWTDGPDGKQLMLTGDSHHVAADRRHVSMLHGVPNTEQ